MIHLYKNRLRPSRRSLFSYTFRPPPFPEAQPQKRTYLFIPSPGSTPALFFTNHTQHRSTGT
ncbi:hypothetical protein EVA_02935 [gut metagenome]|uniref:Uncharacterized protein n=1 Tax=gut metagenome TaxID=749906 RepID=J9H510_9ZZZZ